MDHVMELLDELEKMYDGYVEENRNVPKDVKNSQIQDGTIVAPSAKQPAEPWRTRHTTTTAQFDAMRLMGIQTDCKIIVNYKDCPTPYVIKVHRLQLIRASPVFEAMLTSEMLEAKTGEIEITDLLPKIVDNLLDFIYTDEVNLKTFNEAVVVAYAAEKYQMKTLLDVSVSVIIKFLNHRTVWTALKLANLLGLPDLKDCCIEMMQQQTLDCISTEHFLQNTEENIVILLEQDELSIDNNELVLVNATINWARYEAQRRGLHGDDTGVRTVIEPNILRLLRFATISPEQFKEGPGFSDWLTRSEKEQILEWQELKNTQNWPENLSSSKMSRENPLVYGKRKNRKIHLCKRNVITGKDNLKISFLVKNCRDCLQLYTRLGVAEFFRLYKFKCAHATALFRVNSGCRLLGFECHTRIFNDPDPTLLSSNVRPFYNENMFAVLFNNGPTLVQSPFRDEQLIARVKHTEKTDYHSTMYVRFSKSVKLTPNNWYVMMVMFYADGNEGTPPVEYPLCTRPSKAVDRTSGVEFVFHNKHIPNCHRNENDGVFKTLLFTT